VVGESVSAALVVLLWGSLLVKLHALHWRLRDPDQRANCASLLAVALAMTVFHPPIYRAIDRAAGIPNFARLLGNSLGVMSAWAFQPVIIRLLHGRAHKRGIVGSGWLVTGTIAMMALLFFRASVPVEAPTDFQALYSAAPYTAEYRLVLLAYIGILVLQIFLRSLSNGRVIGSIPQSYLRLQARVQTIGWGLGVAYASLECGYIALALMGVVSSHAYPTTLAYAVFASGCTALLSGGLLGAYHWGAQYRAYRLLYPLWRDLYDATPGIALDPPHSARADMLTLRNLDLHLYRRVTEIRDGVVALQRYTDAAMADRARALCRTKGIPADDTTACIEAIVWAAAIEAKRRGQRVPAPMGGTPMRTDTDLVVEVRHLERVAHAYRRLAGHARTLGDEPHFPPPLPTQMGGEQ
jgi:hypothetical protein